jgi:hypothetical protein
MHTLPFFPFGSLSIFPEGNAGFVTILKRWGIVKLTNIFPSVKLDELGSVKSTITRSFGYEQ